MTGKNSSVLSGVLEASSPSSDASRRPSTIDNKLKQSEAKMLHAIQYRQFFAAGLNTITTVGTANGTKNVANKEIMVLVHGFAGGLAGWAQNWEALSKDFELFAIDLPGSGRSIRPNVSVKSPEDVLDFVTQCLDSWFEAMKFDKPVILLGHSFGAYLVSHYAVRRGPSRVRLLICADPWGVSRESPYNLKSMPLRYKLGLKAFNALNPFGLLRVLGPVAPRVMRLLRPDFAAKWSDSLPDPNVFYDYIYYCNVQTPPLGETLFKACCTDVVGAKIPLEKVLPRDLSRDVPLALLYGSHTWMNAECGFTMAGEMTSKGYLVVADTIENAGHQVFTDNRDEFNEKLQMVCRALLEGHSKSYVAPNNALLPPEAGVVE
ncbi:putative Serine aminopeptidase S33 putatively [Trypanosoma vivax]|uniref:AB hydrolase-1 domain-containing protein n=1 Tax=Trypanosoma vivax (strain Y486) TaxID=1055687 RepID=G0U0F3_TRYVY|nr:hypothetical protein TRVL_04592 [Trypanosoma vivax]KAH8611033.1 putative Serine aminopeptidase S33 putatively [Trypanosoma vivax]CCC49551.1 conserved hypothetical protein [Trypanosoma vivax Y486]